MKKRTSELIENFFTKYSELEYLKESLVCAISLLYTAVLSGNKILVCGNGGSAADSEHISGEMLKSFALKRELSQGEMLKFEKCYGDDGKLLSRNLQGAIPCIPLTSFMSFASAFGNDNDFRFAFAQLVYALGKKGDVLIAISTTGNSKNVYYAAIAAKVDDLMVIALTGRDGGILSKVSDITLNVSQTTTHEIQELHLPIYHLICLSLESELFED